MLPICHHPSGRPRPANLPVLPPKLIISLPPSLGGLGSFLLMTPEGNCSIILDTRATTATATEEGGSTRQGRAGRSGNDLSCTAWQVRAVLSKFWVDDSQIQS